MVPHFLQFSRLPKKNFSSGSATAKAGPCLKQFLPPDSQLRESLKKSMRQRLNVELETFLPLRFYQ